MKNSNKYFVIRVYGLIMNDRKEILVTDEYQLEMKMTKFPGGGLLYGEGTLECLVREIKEECNGQEIKNIVHFYTTDFFQKALFYKNCQLISVYYLAEISGPALFRISDRPFDFEIMENGNQSFRWISVNELNSEEMTFPIDKYVAGMIRKMNPTN